jgi:hypothetical protein
MPSETLEYRSPGIRPQRRSKSATVSITASTLAIVVGLVAYLAIFAGPGPKTMFHGMAMGFVVFFFCAPAFVVAAIAAVVSARSARREKSKLVIVWSLLAVQGLFWIYLIVGSIMNASSSSASHGAPGGF